MFPGTCPTSGESIEGFCRNRTNPNSVGKTVMVCRGVGVGDGVVSCCVGVGVGVTELVGCADGVGILVFDVGVAVGVSVSVIVGIGVAVGVVYGNDKAHVDWVSKKLGMPRSKIDDPNSGLTTQAFFNAVEDWRFAWGALELEYIGNDWVSSMYVYGPNGWCRPDGTISHFKNVGKWPSVGDLVRDWIRVAEAFPFLDLLVTFFDREYCNFVPVFTLRVFEGGVTARVGSPEDGDPTVEPETFNRSSECGLPMSWFEDWAQTHVPRK